MKIRHGRPASFLIWCWFWMIGFACTTNPGATWAVAKIVQEPSKETISAEKAAPFDVIERKYDVGELLNRLKTELPDIENPRDEFLRQLSIRAEMDVTTTDPWAKQSSSLLDGGNVKWLDDSSFGLLEKTDIHNRVSEAIKLMNQFGFRKVNLRVTIVRCSAETWPALPIKWDAVLPASGKEWPSVNSDNAGIASGVLEQREPPVQAKLEWEDVLRVAEALAHDRTSNFKFMRMASIPVGASCICCDGTANPFLDRASDEPKIRTAFIGTAIQPRLRSFNNDEVSLEFRVSQSRFDGFEKFTKHLDLGQQTIELPLIKQGHIESHADIQIGQMFVVGGWETVDEETKRRVLIFIEPELEANTDDSLTKLFATHFHRGKAKLADPKHTVVTVYFVGDMIDSAFWPTVDEWPNRPIDSKTLGFKPDELIANIKNMVEPTSWAEKDSIRFYKNTLSLIVNNTSEVHDQVQDVLELLRELLDQVVRGADIEVITFSGAESAIKEVLPPDFDPAKESLTPYENYFLVNAIEREDDVTKYPTREDKHVNYPSIHLGSGIAVDVPLRDITGLSIAPQLWTFRVLFKQDGLAFRLSGTKYQDLMNGHSLLVDVTDQEIDDVIEGNGKAGEVLPERSSERLYALLTLRPPSSKRSTAVLGRTIK